MITKKEVEHISRLSRLGLSEKEKGKFSKELSAILEFVNKLNEIKVDKIEPTAQVTGLENISRKDVAKERTKKETDKLLNLASDVENRQVKVRAIL